MGEPTPLEARLACNCQACLAWRRCGSLLGGCHSGESQLRAVGVLRHVVCELSDLIELRPSGLEVPLAEGASEPPVTPEEQDRTGLRSRSSGERPSKERQPDPSPDKRDKGTKAKSTERTQEGTSAETPERRRSAEVAEKDKKSKRKRSPKRGDSGANNSRSRRKRSHSQRKDQPASPPASPRGGTGEDPAKETKEEPLSAGEGPATPPGQWTVREAAAPVSRPTNRHRRPPEPPGPPPGWVGSRKEEKKSKGQVRRERSRDINLFGFRSVSSGERIEGTHETGCNTSGSKRSSTSPLCCGGSRRVRRRPGGEAEEGLQQQAVSEEVSAKQVKERCWCRGVLGGVRLAPGAVESGDWIGAIKGGSYPQRAAFGIKAKQGEIEGVEKRIVGTPIQAEEKRRREKQEQEVCIDFTQGQETEEEKDVKESEAKGSGGPKGSRKGEAWKPGSSKKGLYLTTEVLDRHLYLLSWYIRSFDLPWAQLGTNEPCDFFHAFSRSNGFGKPLPQQCPLESGVEGCVALILFKRGKHTSSCTVGFPISQKGTSPWACPQLGSFLSKLTKADIHSFL